jgi:hypothetical protein
MVVSLQFPRESKPLSKEIPVIWKTVLNMQLITIKSVISHLRRMIWYKTQQVGLVSLMKSEDFLYTNGRLCYQRNSPNHRVKVHHLTNNLEFHHHFFHCKSNFTETKSAASHKKTDLSGWFDTKHNKSDSYVWWNRNPFFIVIAYFIIKEIH